MDILKGVLPGTALSGYAEGLYASNSFEEAFSTFEKRARTLGYESALYTYIPRVLVESDFAFKPVFKVSDDYSPDFLSHYEQARFDKCDPLIRAVDAGVKQPIDWWGATCKEFMQGEKASREVIETSRTYGIKSGLTLPLAAGEGGIAGASFINTEAGSANGIESPHLDELVLSTQMFHSYVYSNAGYRGEFIKTLLEGLSQTEKRFLAGLARGQAPSEIAYELKTSERYLEQVMLKIRRKCSGVSATQVPKINRNQLLFYAGLLDILEHVG